MTYVRATLAEVATALAALTVSRTRSRWRKWGQCGPVGSGSHRRPVSAWSRSCRASGPRSTWTRPLRCRSGSNARGLRTACLAGQRARDQRWRAWPSAGVDDTHAQTTTGLDGDRWPTVP